MVIETPNMFNDYLTAFAPPNAIVELANRDAALAELLNPPNAIVELEKALTGSNIITSNIIIPNAPSIITSTNFNSSFDLLHNSIITSTNFNSNFDLLHNRLKAITNFNPNINLANCILDAIVPINQVIPPYVLDFIEEINEFYAFLNSNSKPSKSNNFTKKIIPKWLRLENIKRFIFYSGKLSVSVMSLIVGYVLGKYAPEWFSKISIDEIIDKLPSFQFSMSDLIKIIDFIKTIKGKLSPKHKQSQSPAQIINIYNNCTFITDSNGERKIKEKPNAD